MTTSDARIERLEETIVEIRDRLDRMDARFGQLYDQMATGFDCANARMDNLHDQMAVGFDRINARFERVDERFERIEERLGRTDERVGRQYQWFTALAFTMSGAMLASTVTIAVAVITKL